MAQPSDRRFNSIPASDKYEGMVKRRIPGTELCISVLGWGPEAEVAAEEALSKALARRAEIHKPEELDG